jgi:LysR family glycine cleavage system transcriptional activator
MASPSLPPLSAIRCFEAAARHQSFTRAAEELGMTQAAVSYQIKLLEERVGGALFKRGARGVTLTETGQRLAPAISGAFARLRAAFEEVVETGGRTLTVSTIATIAANWLVPRLGSFQRAHPDIAVRLDVTSELVDFARAEIDLAIRSGKGEWTGLVAHRLLSIEYTPMLSPRLLAGLPPLKTPSDLLAMPLIEPSDEWWIDWFAAAGVAAADLPQRTEMRLGTQHLAGTAALAAQGVAMLTPGFYADELAAGRLVQPFPLVRKSAHSFWLVYPEARRRSAKIRAFRDWILSEAGTKA